MIHLRIWGQSTANPQCNYTQLQPQQQFNPLQFLQAPVCSLSTDLYMRCYHYFFECDFLKIEPFLSFHLWYLQQVFNHLQQADPSFMMKCLLLFTFLLLVFSCIPKPTGARTFTACLLCLFLLV